MKTLSTVLREQGITRKAEILEFVRNAQLITVANKKKVDSSKAEFYYSDTKSNFRFGSANHYASNLFVVSSYGKTLEDFGKQLQKLDAKIAEVEKEKEEIRAKIQYMRSAGAKEFNEKEFKAYKILQTIKQGGMNDFEKAKLISELIK